jgi:hypothetical protein
MDDEDGWIFYGHGSMHDLDVHHPEPRLWFAKSVSRNAAEALSRRPEPKRHPIGFHHPHPGKPGNQGAC